MFRLSKNYPAVIRKLSGC